MPATTEIILDKTQAPAVASPIRNVAYATAIRYFWWGFAELLIPLFIFSFVGSYSETGLISASYEIASIIALPIIAYVADRWGVKRLMTISLLLYPLVSLSYFFAGVFGIVLFIVLARWINGVSVSLYSVGEKTVARTYASRNVSSNIGYMESFANLLWMCAALIGVAWIDTQHVAPFYLLLLIAPTALIALYFIRKLPSKKITPDEWSHTWHYHDIWNHIKNLPKKLRAYGSIYTANSAFSSLLWLIVPLYIYVDTANIYLVVISGVIMALPSLFSYYLGKVADRQPISSIWWSFVLMGVFFLSFIIIPWYVGKLLILFILAVLFVFVGLMVDNLSNAVVLPNEYGKIEATFETFAKTGAIIGPIFWGWFLDSFGITILMLIIGVCAVSVSILFHSMRKTLTPEHALE